VSVARTKASAPPCTNQVAASSIRAVASPPANIAKSQEFQASGVTETMTGAHWAVGRELLARIAPCRKRPRIDGSML